uniref:Taste receptor type 2 n=1 Tax=Cairina moschata TaxID=8855 RepID=A0A8C3C0Q7_CAIMO
MEASHSQQQLNATSYDITVMVVITLQAFAGMWINAFIVAVSCLTWVKKKSFNSSEKILLFLGCSRFWFLCVTWAYTITSMLFHWQIYIRRVPRIFAPLLCISNSSNLWFSTCLYVFYCIKIANFRHIFFIYLKVKIDRIVPWLLLGSVVLSLVMCSPVFDITSQVSCCNLNSTSLEYFRKLNEKINKQYSSIFYICGFGFSIAFIIVIFSALLLLFSLWRHKRKMQTSSAKNLTKHIHTNFVLQIISAVAVHIYTQMDRKSPTYSLRPTKFTVKMHFTNLHKDALLWPAASVVLPYFTLYLRSASVFALHYKFSVVPNRQGTLPLPHFLSILLNRVCVVLPST